MVEVDFFDISLDVHFLLVTFVSSFSGASYVILNVVTGTLEDLLEEYMAWDVNIFVDKVVLMEVEVSEEDNVAITIGDGMTVEAGIEEVTVEFVFVNMVTFLVSLVLSCLNVFIFVTVDPSFSVVAFTVVVFLNIVDCWVRVKEVKGEVVKVMILYVNCFVDKVVLNEVKYTIDIEDEIIDEVDAGIVDVIVVTGTVYVSVASLIVISKSNMFRIVKQN